MATLPANCANYQLNQQMCTCPKLDCPNHGICCECIQAHAARNSQTNCMRGARRDTATMGLMTLAVKKCATNQVRNTEFCVCSYDPCERKGVCCNCVRNHFTTDGSGRVACMKGG